MTDDLYPGRVAISADTLGGPRFDVLPPLALYVHIPWCVRKCPYCDFNSHEARGDVPEDAYVDALLTDLEHALPGVWGARSRPFFLAAARRACFPPPRSTACSPVFARAFRCCPTPRSRWKPIRRL